MVKFLYIVMLFVSTFVMADQSVLRSGNIVTVMVLGEYIMSNSDSTKEAQDMALIQAKINANDAFSTYIESNYESLIPQKNGDSVNRLNKDELQTIAVAILKSEVTSDQKSTLANKKTVYKIAIKGSIDLSILGERIKLLQEDKSKRDRIISLTTKRRELEYTLETMNAINRKLDTETRFNNNEIISLHRKRELLIAQLENNEGDIKRVFEKKSMRNEYEERVAKAKEIAATVNNLFDADHFSKYIIVNTQQPKIIDADEKRGIYTVEMTYDCAFDEDTALKALDEKSIKYHYFSQGSTIELNSEYYRELGIMQMLNDPKLFPEKYIKIVFMVANKPVIQINQYRKGATMGGVYMKNNFVHDSCDNRDQTITFQLSKKQLDEEIQTKIVVESR